jgi:hypothetical protein
MLVGVMIGCWGNGKHILVSQSHLGGHAESRAEHWAGVLVILGAGVDQSTSLASSRWSARKLLTSHIASLPLVRSIRFANGR